VELHSRLAKMASAHIHHRHGGVCGQLGAPAKERFGKLTDGRADDGSWATAQLATNGGQRDGRFGQSKGARGSPAKCARDPLEASASGPVNAYVKVHLGGVTPTE